jgi:Ca2+-binding EF-hand superfamily protein
METKMNTRWIKLTALGAVLGLAGFSALAAAQPSDSAGKGPGGHGHPGRAFAEHWFRSMDANNDGKLSQQEVETGTLRLFDRLDANKDGEVTREEADTGAAAIRKEELSKHFREVDADKDGRLTAEESKIPPRFFDRLDTNHDHAISLEEFLAQPDFGGHRRESVFEHADQNRDGKVTRAEAQQAAKERFDRLDANHDGVVTREEFSQHMKQMAEAHGQHENGEH